MTADEERAIAGLWAQGLSVREIADHVGYAEQTVRIFAHRHRELCPYRRPPKRTDEGVARMWALRSKGMSWSAIARELGISPATVWLWRATSEDGECENMTATEELRALLDAKGVEWWPLGNDMTECVVDGVRIKYRQVGRGLIVSTCTEGTVTPAQAIAVTLGRGTCRNTEQLPLSWSFTCSECGVHSITEGERFNYCPNCGAEVTDG